MAVLIDSDVLIEILRGRNQEIIARWDQLLDSDEVALCSPVSVAEVWRGARPREYGTMESLFNALACIPLDQNVGMVAGQYLQKYAASHGLELGDSLIAATAANMKARLWTRNRKHYPMAEVEFY